MIAEKAVPANVIFPIAAVADQFQDRLPMPGIHPPPIARGDHQALAEALAAIPDPRRRGGVRHPFIPLLSAAVCAMLCGARRFAAITEWVADLSGPARASLALTEVTPASDDRQVQAALARGHRPGMDAVPHRPAPLHPGGQEVDVVLARPQSPLPPIRSEDRPLI
jgi:hypothetical protein